MKVFLSIMIMILISSCCHCYKPNIKKPKIQKEEEKRSVWIDRILERNYKNNKSKYGKHILIIIVYGDITRLYYVDKTTFKEILKGQEI